MTKCSVQLRTAASHDLTCSRVSSTLRVVLDEKLTSANWHLRQAALIWLFVLMKRGGRWHPAIKASLDRLQEAFIDGLAETNGVLLMPRSLISPFLLRSFARRRQQRTGSGLRDGYCRPKADHGDGFGRFADDRSQDEAAWNHR
jgi:hypothetical protein